MCVECLCVYCLRGVVGGGDPLIFIFVYKMVHFSN